jgi:dolichol-phosphate mannosyltransferase
MVPTAIDHHALLRPVLHLLKFLGIIGEYIARIYQEGKKRPLYIVDQLIGFDE